MTHGDNVPSMVHLHCCAGYTALHRWARRQHTHIYVIWKKNKKNLHCCYTFTEFSSYCLEKFDEYTWQVSVKTDIDSLLDSFSQCDLIVQYFISFMFVKWCLCIRIIFICSIFNTQSSYLLSGEKSCAIWSTAGSVVQRGSTFKVYCTFKFKCKGSMYSDHPPKLESHEKLNSTTIYLNVVNITKNRTYSCQCALPFALDPCGLDISAGCECEVTEHECIPYRFIQLRSFFIPLLQPWLYMALEVQCELKWWPVSRINFHFPIILF